MTSIRWATMKSLDALYKGTRRGSREETTQPQWKFYWGCKCVIIGCREQHHCKQLYRDQQNKEHSCRFHSLSRFFSSADESLLKNSQWRCKRCSELHYDGDSSNKLSRTQQERQMRCWSRASNEMLLMEPPKESYATEHDKSSFRCSSLPMETVWNWIKVAEPINGFSIRSVAANLCRFPHDSWPSSLRWRSEHE